MAARYIAVERSSIKTKNCVEKQNTPHKFCSVTSSSKLWIVELIQRLRWDSNTRNSDGTQVWQIALGTKTNFLSGNVLSINTKRYLSSRSRSKFFWCSVWTSVREYCAITPGFVMIGTQFFPPALGAFIRYILKHPGRQVTEPNRDSTALNKWWFR